MKKIMFLLLMFSSFLFGTTIEKGFEYFKKGNYIAAFDVLVDKLNNDKNINKIVRFLEKSCQDDNYYGCAGLAGIYAKKDKARAFNLADKACKHNNYYGCVVLGMFYKYGIGVNKNEKKYFQLINKASVLAGKECKKGNVDSCLAIAVAYANGSLIRRDYNKAIKFYEKACKNGDQNICMLLGLVYEDKFIHIRRIIYKLFKSEYEFYYHIVNDVKNSIESPDYKKSINFYNIACQNGKVIACYQIGRLYQSKLHNNREARKYFEKSIELLKEECKRGKGKVCYKIADIYKLNLQNKKKANKFYKKSIEIFDTECKNNNAKKCALLGVIYKKGLGVKVDHKKAQYYFDRVCKIDKNLCKDIKMMYFFER